jgi:hypothetical protein
MSNHRENLSYKLHLSHLHTHDYRHNIAVFKDASSPKCTKTHSEISNINFGIIVQNWLHTNLFISDMDR